ncbi:MAG: hypothetical protein H7328_10415 [Bdellovibrio sp.]|nr:hypothetical protein [Bdellovibrio sp.]
MRIQFRFFSSIISLFLISSVAIFTGCSPVKLSTDGVTSTNSSSSTPDTSNNETAPVVQSLMQSLVWEKTVPQSKLWSAYIYKVIKEEEPQLLNSDAALDTDLFCPRFKLMTADQRLNFWGQLFAGMAKYESGWNPLSRYIETTMPNDSITGLPTASEGLLQLSYQDVPNYNNFCEFDWNKDKLLSIKDPKRTILDPYKNLRCGIKIMARIIKKRGVIATDKGAYWAVIQKNGSHHRIPEISAITKSLKFCL